MSGLARQSGILANLLRMDRYTCPLRKRFGRDGLILGLAR